MSTKKLVPWANNADWCWCEVTGRFGDGLLQKPFLHSQVQPHMHPRTHFQAAEPRSTPRSRPALCVGMGSGVGRRQSLGALSGLKLAPQCLCTALVWIHLIFTPLFAPSASCRAIRLCSASSFACSVHMCLSWQHQGTPLCSFHTSGWLDGLPLRLCSLLKES